MRTFRHHLAITGRPRKSRVVTDPARVDADRPKRVVRRTLNEYHSHLMAGPRLHSQLTHRALFKLLLAPPMTGSCRPPAVHRLKPKGRRWGRYCSLAKLSTDGRYLREGDGWSRREPVIPACVRGLRSCGKTAVPLAGVVAVSRTHSSGSPAFRMPSRIGSSWARNL
jgi:hypothetical protein